MSRFGDAFAAARKAGKSEFTFGGRSYNTRMKQNLPDAEVGGKKDGGVKWADAGAEEAKRLGTKSTPRDDEPKSTTKAGEGWGDKYEARTAAGYKRGGMVKPSGPATINVTRSNRDYGKKR